MSLKETNETITPIDKVKIEEKDEEKDGKQDRKHEDCAENPRITPQIIGAKTFLRENDVLLGRGSGVNNHYGNKVFRALVQKQKDRYKKSRSQNEKKLIAIEIVKTVESSNGRFLVRNSDTSWIEVNFAKAVTKASQALREGAPIRTIREISKNKSSTDNAPTARSKNREEHASKKAKNPQANLSETNKIQKDINPDQAMKNVVTTPSPHFFPLMPAQAASPHMSFKHSEQKMPESTSLPIGNHNFHGSFSDTMVGASRTENTDPKWHAFPNDPLADMIFNILRQQPIITPFGRFLQNILLPQQSYYTSNLFHPQWRIPKKVGDFIAQDITFKMINLKSSTENLWADVTTKALFENKRIVLFACPAAFNKPCTESHVPEYQHAYDEIISNDIDDVYCVSVNDALVMREWFKSMNFPEESLESQQGRIPHIFSKVKILPDCAGHFTKMMGMSCTLDVNFGFGDRSWRYSAVINNFKIEQLFMEVNGALTPNINIPIIVSDANTMLKYLRSVKNYTQMQDRASNMQIDHRSEYFNVKNEQSNNNEKGIDHSTKSAQTECVNASEVKAKQSVQKTFIMVTRKENEQK